MRNLGFDSSIAQLEAEAGRLGEPDARERVAHGYGFLTWRQLIVFQLLWGKRDSGQPENQKPAFLRRACLTYGKDQPEHLTEAQERLAEDPSLGQKDIWSAACVGDVERVNEFLRKDPSLLNQRGGFFDWEPLLYATYSRLEAPGMSTSEVGRTLLAQGADPNAHYYWGGVYRFTALTGVFGHGESGPQRCPEHPGGLDFARLLLESGADRNDGQALYNRMFADEQSECLKLLLEFGLDGKAQNNWRAVDDAGRLGPNTETVLAYQLRWALQHHHTERARLLIDHGADLSTQANHPAPFHIAMLAGHPDLAEYMASQGAERIALAPTEELAALCMAGNRARAQALLKAEPKLLEQLREQHPGLLHTAAGGNRLQALRLIVELGWDVNSETRNRPLHEAAWNGRVEAVQLLIELGADPSIKDATHGGTTLDWARVAGRQAVVDLLS